MHSVQEKCSVTTNNFFPKNNLNNYEKFNDKNSACNYRISSAMPYNSGNNTTFLSNQSPKIYSGKLRENTHKKSNLILFYS